MGFVSTTRKIDWIKFNLKTLVNLLNTLKGRLYLSFLMHLFFIILSRHVGIDQTFLYLLPPFMIITIIYYLRNKSNTHFSKRAILFSAFTIVLLVAVIVLFTPNKIDEWFTIIVRQGLREELMFRFCMLGILVSCKKWNEAKYTKRLFLIINSAYFAVLHAQYQTISEYSTIFLISFLFFGFLFLKYGVVPAIVAHTIWNFYLNLYYMIPLIIMSLVEEIVRIAWSRKRKSNISNPRS